VINLTHVEYDTLRPIGIASVCHNSIDPEKRNLLGYNRSGGLGVTSHFAISQSFSAFCTIANKEPMHCIASGHTLQRDADFVVPTLPYIYLPTSQTASLSSAGIQHTTVDIFKTSIS
jgi:hypothetical protein